MSALTFTVTDIVSDRYAASPLLIARIHIEESADAVVHAMALRCQVRIDPMRRQYDETTGGLSDLFGPRERWGSTLKSLLWMHASTMVSGFTHGIDIEMPMPCSYDFEVAATKYLYAVRDGEIPLALMFNGTVFTRGGNGLQVEQLPWQSEAAYRMPVEVWHDTMDAFFPNSAWIRISRETIDALDHFRTDRGFIGWEEMFQALLATAPQDGELERPVVSRESFEKEGLVDGRERVENGVQR